MMKYYLIAGEASGDLHGSNLIKAIRHQDAGASIRCWGGDKMQAAGATVVKHFRDLAFMGFAEVLMNLPTILRNLRFCKQDIARWRPDVLVFIDYPGFNIKIAEWAKPLGYKTVWYISPQVWAWKEGRVKTLRRCVDQMLCILPFEKDFYRKWNYEVVYVGHPLIEVIRAARQQYEATAPVPEPAAANAIPVIALLPGSRKQELLKKLPVMLEVARRMPQYRFVVAKAPGLDDAFYEPLLQPYPNVSAVRDATYHLLQQATAALVTSGTATLETALFGVPQVVCYKGNPISYQIAKRLIKIRYISLVNLIMDRQVVTELIQDEMNAGRVQTELEKILKDKAVYQQMKTDYAALWELLRAGGNASEKAAAIITDLVR